MTIRDSLNNELNTVNGFIGQVSEQVNSLQVSLTTFQCKAAAISTLMNLSDQSLDEVVALIKAQP